jgi:GNAT superfamily N-acetyltransferase
METTFEPATSVPHYLIATIGDEIVGFAGFRDSWFMTGAHELIWINVKRGFQGKGIGRLLTQKREEIIKWMGGTIIVLMTKEIQFFQKMGYVAHHRYDGWWLMSKQVGTIELGSDL